MPKSLNTQLLASSLQGNLGRPGSANQRAYADYIEEHCCSLAKTEYGSQYQPARSVRSPEDFTVQVPGITHWIDVKTRQLGRDFSMPNLISVDRLEKIMSDPMQELWYWMVDYEVLPDGTCQIRSSEIREVWSLPWEALAIQNLGKGQLQICDWSKITERNLDRPKWQIELTDQRRRFYTRQIVRFKRMLDAL
mgnify:CR=1 FL=1